MTNTNQIVRLRILTRRRCLMGRLCVNRDDLLAILSGVIENLAHEVARTQHTILEAGVGIGFGEDRHLPAQTLVRPAEARLS